MKKLGILMLVVLGLFAIMNWQYFSAQIGYYLHPPRQDHTAEKEQTAIPEVYPPNKIKIPSLGIDAPIIYVEKENEDDFQVGLRSGTVHYPGTAMPGQNGNVYIFGHSSDFITAPGDYKTVFALLPKIELNATIEVTDPDGKKFNYKVADKFAANNSDVHLLKQDLSKKQLTLQTSYPIGTALRRYIIIAYLIE